MIPDSRNRSLLLFVLATLAGLSCVSETVIGPVGSDPGVLQVVVEQAPPDSGGLLVEIGGELTGPVSPAGPHQIWQHEASSTRTVVLLRGTVSPGRLLEIPAADRGAEYSVRILEAAADRESGFQRHAPDDYRVRVERQD